MKQKIYCIKINQKMLNDPQFTYWPYDRSYLIHKDNMEVAPRMFRYYFYLPLNSRLLKVLNKIEINAYREIPVSRDDEKSTYRRGSSTGQFNWIKEPEEWTIIIPTHVKGKYKNNKAVSSFLEYISTKAITTHQHNSRIDLPQISLHTPKREINFFCAVCSNLPQFYHDECKPGTLTCKRKVDTELPYDPHFRLALKRSIEEAGGE